MVARRAAVLLPVALCWLCFSCEPLVPCEDMEIPIAQSEEGLIVTPAEHPDGWGRQDCQACHILQVVHQRECTTGVDYLELEEFVFTDGYDSCQACHGTNGVDP